MIYRMIESPDVPSIEVRDPDCLTEEQWDINIAVQEGQPGYEKERWIPFDLVRSRRNKQPVQKWDYFSHDTGAFSERAINVLSPCFGDRFEPLPVNVEGVKYFCLQCRCRIDCLDRDASQIEYLDDKKKYVDAIQDFRVRKGMVTDPSIFMIPEMPMSLYATDGVPEIAARAGLTGLYFEQVGGPAPVPTGSYLYQNTFFKFQIDFPNTWTVTTWRQGNLPDGEHRYQVSDDDLRGEDDKCLFRAILYHPPGQVHVDASIELSLWPGPDLGAVLRENLNRQQSKTAKSGTWKCGDRTFEFVDTLYQRFFFAKTGEKKLWFYGVINSPKKKFFSEAVQVMESLRPLS